MKKILLLLAAVGLTLSAVHGQELKQRIIDHMNYLASDELGGREPNTRGDTLAAHYIRDFFAALPGAQLLGEEGLQSFSYEAYRELHEQGCQLWVGKRVLHLGRDFTPSLSSAAGNFIGEVVDMGNGKEENYIGKDVEGKFVLVHLTPRSYTDGKEQRACELLALKYGAIGVIHAGQPLSNLPARWPTGQLGIFKVSESVAKTLPGKTIAGNVEIEVLVEHTFNVVAKIAAPAENNPQGDVIVLGAHYDHMGIGEYEGQTRIFYGADDNASGTVGIMELGRMISERRAFLKKDVLLIAFGAEERGLKGSKYYAENPLEPLENVKVMVNIDMMGRMSAKGMTIRGIGTAYEAPALFASLPENEMLDMVWEFRGMGPTDYSAFYAKGIPAFSFGTRSHPDYHTPWDNVERINYDGMVTVYHYIENLINRLAFEPLRLTFRKTE